MRQVLQTTPIYGPMDLIYKTAAILELETIPYKQFHLWFGIANKLISKEKSRFL